MTDAPMNSYRPVTIASGVRTSAERTPNKIALREGGRELSYARLVERIGLRPRW